MSDRLRLLEALHDAGSRGLTTFEIRRGGISGNPSERRRELLAEGYVIEAESCKEGHRRGKRFILVHDIERNGGMRPPTAPPAAVAPGAVGDTLFELPPGRSAALHDHEEAA